MSIFLYVLQHERATKKSNKEVLLRFVIEVFCALFINRRLSAKQKANEGRKRNLSFINVPMFTTKLDVINNVPTKNNMQNEIGSLFLIPIKA